MNEAFVNTTKNMIREAPLPIAGTEEREKDEYANVSSAPPADTPLPPSRPPSPI